MEKSITLKSRNGYLEFVSLERHQDWSVLFSVERGNKEEIINIWSGLPWLECEPFVLKYLDINLEPWEPLRLNDIVDHLIYRTDLYGWQLEMYGSTLFSGLLDDSTEEPIVADPVKDGHILEIVKRVRASEKSKINAIVEQLYIECDNDVICFDGAAEKAVDLRETYNFQQNVFTRVLHDCDECAVLYIPDFKCESKYAIVNVKDAPYLVYWQGNFIVFSQVPTGSLSVYSDERFEALVSEIEEYNKTHGMVL